MIALGFQRGSRKSAMRYCREPEVRTALLQDWLRTSGSKRQ
jgi:hypothetical protein